ncbi:MAG: hypothetical protein DHS20C21_09320 [Gemmatimonadota bacterium]|nr:MAG: hypothetical protein DHS20C21_09320 [Gemmatimonadota bacterium]
MLIYIGAEVSQFSPRDTVFIAASGRITMRFDDWAEHGSAEPAAIDQVLSLVCAVGFRSPDESVEPRLNWFRNPSADQVAFTHDTIPPWQTFEDTSLGRSISTTTGMATWMTWRRL